MTIRDAVSELLRDGSARTIKEIVAELQPRLGSSAGIIKRMVEGKMLNDRRFDRRRRFVDGKGRAPFEYFIIDAPAGLASTPAVPHPSAAMTAAIVGVLGRGGFHQQDDIVREVASATGATPDQVRIRLTVMAARGELDRASVYRIPRRSSNH